MKVSNIRFGFATNSSSTHSIVLNQRISDNYDGQEFGWDEWSLSSSEAKSLYLGQTLYQALRDEVGDELAKSVVHDLLKVNINPDGYIDHQSLMTLPTSPKTKNISLEFFKELLERYLNPDITIVGGNDNEEPCIFPESIRHPHLISTDIGQNLYCRKDRDWWLLQNRYTGTKVRVSFNDNADPYTKSTVPELIDLKITNFCVKDCPYCYQASSFDGKHASMDNIHKVIWDLSKIGVFEVALGGGEPTRHPLFSDIVRLLWKEGIIVNFTTNDLKWTEDVGIVKTVREHVSRFGISVRYARDMRDAFAMVPTELHHKIYFHYVIGTGSLKDVLDCPNTQSIILLGFKTNGRGGSYKTYSPENDWIETITKERPYSEIGIDTALANQYKDKVKTDFDKFLVQYDEGKFSMYIDAVEMKAGKCSYTDEYTSVKGFKEEDYLKLFSSY